MIYFMASGASEKMAYSHAAFLFTEMQWIDAAAYNTGEYFHGPFEVSTEGKPYVFFMSDGATRRWTLAPSPSLSAWAPRSL